MKCEKTTVNKYSAIESDIDILCPISFTGTTAYFQLVLGLIFPLPPKMHLLKL